MHAEGRAAHAFWSEPGASVVLEWLNHIIELVLCCSSNRNKKMLTDHNWDIAIDFFTAGVTALQERIVVIVWPLSFWAQTNLCRAPRTR